MHGGLTPSALLGHELLLVGVLRGRIVALENFDDELGILLPFAWGYVRVLEPLSPGWGHTL